MAVEVTVICSAKRSVTLDIKQATATEDAIRAALAIFRVEPGENPVSIPCALCLGQGKVHCPLTVKVSGARIMMEHDLKEAG